MRVHAGILRASLGAAGCAVHAHTVPLTSYRLDTGYRFELLTREPRNSDARFVILTFSGGGTRAADGWGFAFDTGGVSLDVARPIAGARTTIGRVRITPLLAGIAYTLRKGRVEMTGSLTGGYALGALDLSREGRDAYGQRLGQFDLDADASNGAALLPKVSVWYDVGSKAGVSASAGYFVVRPELDVENGNFRDRVRVHVDAWRIGAGVAFKVF